MDRIRNHADLVWTAVGLVLVSLLLKLADRLVEPVKGIDICGLDDEMFRGLLQLEKVEHLHSPFIHLFIPLLLVVFSLAVSVTVCVKLFRSIRSMEDSLVTQLVKSTFILLFLFVIAVTGRMAWILIGF